MSEQKNKLDWNRVVHVAGVISIIFILIAGFQSFYYAGSLAGFETGYNDGYGSGYDSGYKWGYNDGLDDPYRDVYYEITNIEHNRVSKKVLINTDLNQSIMDSYGWTSKMIVSERGIQSGLYNLGVGIRLWFNFTFWMNVTHDEFTANYLDNAIAIVGISGDIIVGRDFTGRMYWDLGKVEITFDSVRASW